LTERRHVHAKSTLDVLKLTLKWLTVPVCANNKLDAFQDSIGMKRVARVNNPKPAPTQTRSAVFVPKTAKFSTRKPANANATKVSSPLARKLA
jgi:hypothetical protein